MRKLENYSIKKTFYYHPNKLLISRILRINPKIRMKKKTILFLFFCSLFFHFYSVNYIIVFAWWIFGNKEVFSIWFASIHAPHTFFLEDFSIANDKNINNFWYYEFLSRFLNIKTASIWHIEEKKVSMSLRKY